MRPLIFGEILFDHFPDGKRVLGGAPFNVAWHLQGLGANPLVVSCVGQDPPGTAALDAMAEWGMDRRAVHVDASHPTGTVAVALDAGEPKYDIRADQAYDYVPADVVKHLQTDVPYGLLYHGTLALRTEAARVALAAIRDTSDLPLYVDLNLRAPWWDCELIGQVLEAARWVKLNDDELAIVARESRTSHAGLEGLEAQAKRLASHYALEQLIVTRGARGAVVVGPDHPPIQTEAAPITSLVDTVGAGDAFSAVFLIGLLREWDTETTLKRAVRFASAICSVPGATTRDAALYRTLSENWGEAQV
jgi:fructokinase